MNRFWSGVIVALLMICGAHRAAAETAASDIEQELLGRALVEAFEGTCNALIQSGSEGEIRPENPDPIPEITETDKKVIIRIPLPIGGHIITVTISINKRTGRTTITVCGIVLHNVELPCLTYHIRPGSKDIVDDLPWPVETRFCTWERQEDGSVIYDCDFDYWGIKYKGRIKIWVNERGELCRQIDEQAPLCEPLTRVPPEILEIWRRINIPYLPPAPPPPPPCHPHREYLCPGDPDGPYYVGEAPVGDDSGGNNF